MPAQIGYFDTLKSVAGKVFTYLASITLTGTDGKTITVTQNTSLDEAVAMSSKAKVTTPEFIGAMGRSATTIAAPQEKTWALQPGIGDTTVAIVITFGAAGAWLGSLIEIYAGMGRGGVNSVYSSIVRYSIASKNVGDTAIVTDMTHDLVGGTTESVSVTNNVVTITLTTAQALGYVGLFIRWVGYEAAAPTSVTAS